jgi:SAM-dependent methyltransferase
MSQPFLTRLVDAAAEPYRAAGRFAWHFARSKLTRDPVFTALLARGLIADDSRLLDIGCGQGLFAAWLRAAAALHARGDWRADWPAPPRITSLHGIELMPRDVARARRALGDTATFTLGDMRNTAFEPADVAIILDVLHYVDIGAQDEVLGRVRDALHPAGTLLLRVGNPDAGLPFRVSIWVDQAVTIARGLGVTKLYCRSLPAWRAALTRLGFDVLALDMHQGTPFANVLLIAKLKHHVAAERAHDFAIQ